MKAAVVCANEDVQYIWQSFSLGFVLSLLS